MVSGVPLSITTLTAYGTPGTKRPFGMVTVRAPPGFESACSPAAASGGGPVLPANEIV